MSDDRPPTLDEAWTEIGILRYRVHHLEAENAILRGTLSRYDAPDDQPIIVHDCPPDAPR